MPIVTIQVTREGAGPGRDSVTAEEKAKLIAGASQLLLDVLNKPLESTFVVIEEVELENWGWGGLPAPEYRRQRLASAEAATALAVSQSFPRRRQRAAKDRARPGISGSHNRSGRCRRQAGRGVPAHSAVAHRSTRSRNCGRPRCGKTI
jgi:4-oxalocrotonate tautomerase